MFFINPIDKNSGYNDNLKFPLTYEGHFRSNITVAVISLNMMQFSKTIPRFVRLYISYKMVKSETKIHAELEDSRFYIR